MHVKQVVLIAGLLFGILFSQSSALAKDKKLSFKPSTQLRCSLFFKQLKSRIRRFGISHPPSDIEQFNNWLATRQQSGRVPENPYGFDIVESRTMIDMFRVRVSQSIAPRRAPEFIDRKAVQSWALDYYRQYKMLPPGYNEVLKTEIRQAVQQGSQGLLGFENSRRLYDVAMAFGPNPFGDDPKSKLGHIIRNMGPEDILLDGGTGYGYVLTDILKELVKKLPIEKIAHFIGISVEESAGKYFTSDKDLLAKVKFLEGRFFEDIPTGEISPQNSVRYYIDFYGIFTYTYDVSTFLNKILTLLRKDGTILIAHSDMDIVITPDGQEVKLSDWLRSVPGLIVQTGKGEIRTDGRRRPNDYMEIQIAEGASPVVPSLLFAGVRESISHRIFVVAEDRP